MYLDCIELNICPIFVYVCLFVCLFFNSIVSFFSLDTFYLHSSFASSISTL